MSLGVRVPHRLPTAELERRLMLLGPVVLAVSVLQRVREMGNPIGWSMTDLNVYWSLSPNLLHGGLYDKSLPFTADFPLPFTYPPFAAAVFLPLTVLSWLATKIVWHALSVGCLCWFSRSTLRMIARQRQQTWDRFWELRALFWAGLALWCEPVRTTLGEGQINLVLAAVLMAGLASRRDVLAGLGVGVTAGIKLTPAVSVLYFAAARRWRALGWSAAWLVITIAIGALFSASASWRYWHDPLGVSDAPQPVGSAINQSLRGALSRTFGHDVG
ncbi:MAG: DUF2029 domain-containing protein, partial [Sciscionella sp.]|nr:DUF2029 domain-containing protein [Sciscionella sp.]